MFGLTKREQRWKAEQQAAEVLAELAKVAVRAAADVRIAEANAELGRLRKEVAELRAAHGVTAAPAPDLPGWKPSTLPLSDEQLKTAMANATAARAYAVGADPKTAVPPAGMPWCREFARAVLNALGVMGEVPRG